MGLAIACMHSMHVRRNQIKSRSEKALFWFKTLSLNMSFPPLSSLGMLRPGDLSLVFSRRSILFSFSLNIAKTGPRCLFSLSSQRHCSLPASWPRVPWPKHQDNMCPCPPKLSGDTRNTMLKCLGRDNKRLLPIPPLVSAFWPTRRRVGFWVTSRCPRKM